MCFLRQHEEALQSSFGVRSSSLIVFCVTYETRCYYNLLSVGRALAKVRMFVIFVGWKNVNVLYHFNTSGLQFVIIFIIVVYICGQFH